MWMWDVDAGKCVRVMGGQGSTMRQCDSASRTQPRRTTVANTAITKAPPASRAVTAAVGLQPATISDLPSGPDIPKASAEPTAKASPARNRCEELRAVRSVVVARVAAMVTSRNVVMSKMSFGTEPYRREES